MRETLERLVDVERFNMGPLHDAVWPLIEEHPSTRTPARVLREQIGANYRNLSYAVLRHAFLIELVKLPKVETTKFRVRWFEQLTDDQRYCSFDECLAIAADLLTELTTWYAVPEHKVLLQLFFQNSALSYEAPLDYRERPARGDNATRIHRLGNLSWFYDGLAFRTLKLRRFLLEEATSPDAEFFKAVLDDKIKIKTYLTDRALTGLFKTNREKRWETHPHSVQFATRRTALEIEYELVTQLCAFEGFPPASREALQAEGILPADLKTFRCPVTLEPMSFPLFREALLNPQHGKSGFQVGHLNPLKLDEPGNDVAGHTADNISWISEDGNRIQGSLSLNNVRQLLLKIAANYEELGRV